MKLSFLQTYCRSLPASISKRLLANDEIKSFAGLDLESYRDFGILQYHDVIEALKQCASKGGTVEIVNSKGEPISLERCPDGIELTTTLGDPITRKVLEFEFFDPDPTVRLRALATMGRKYTPWIVDEDKWKARLKRDALAPAEARSLRQMIINMPAVVLSSINDSFQRNAFNVDSAVPESVQYFEMLIGPRPEGEDTDTYLSEVLKAHHKTILTRDLSIGLRFALPATVRGDLALTPHVDDIPDEQLLVALEETQRWTTPYSALGVFEIAASRAHGSERCASIADVQIEKLVAATFSDSQGNDAYQLIPPLVRMCLRRISVLDDLAAMPAYWRRLAAFVHAHFLAEILCTQSLNSNEFTEWCDRQVHRGDVLRTISDMRAGPSWRDDRFTPMAFRCEILGRLLHRQNLVKTAGKGLLGADRLMDAVTALPVGTKLMPFFSGPLEAHGRRRQQMSAPQASNEATAGQFAKMISDLEGPENEKALELLGANSMLFAYDDAALGAICDAFRTMNKSDAEGLDRRLNSALAIATLQPSEELANNVASCVIDAASEFSTAELVGAGFQALVIASAAFVDEDKSIDWMSEMLTQYAYAVPSGPPSAALCEYLDGLRSMLPPTDWRFGHARAAALAGR